MPTDVRLRRIADAHHKDVDESGGTWGDCAECGHVWPCPTYRWATDPTAGVFCDWDLDECAWHADEDGEPGRHDRVSDPRPV